MSTTVPPPGTDNSQAAYLAAMQKLQDDSNTDSLANMQTTAALNRNNQVTQAVATLDK